MRHDLPLTNADVEVTVLGYRAFFTVQDARDVVGLTQQQLHAWLRGKGHDADRLGDGGLQKIGDTATGSTMEHRPRDGSRTVRSRIVEESRPGQRWTTELTVHQAGQRGESWVWLDVLAPEDGPRIKTPRLASLILDVVEARDGDMHLTSEPRLVMGPDEIDDLVRALTVPGRRSLAFVAGSHAAMGIPLEAWRGYIGRLLKQTRGMAAGYVLDPVATKTFADAMGDHHAVAPAAMRTYQPEVVLGDRADALRHRLLSTRRMADEREHFLADMLGRRAGDIVLETALPAEVQRLDRVLRSQLDERLVADARPRRPAPLAPQTTRTTTPPVVERRSAAHTATREAFAQLLSSLTGSSVLTGGAVDLLRALAENQNADRSSSVGQDAAIDQLQARIADLEVNVDREAQRRREALKRSEDEQLERAIAEDDRAEAERHLRYLQKRYASASDADEHLWTRPPVEAADVPPSSLDDLLLRLKDDELEHVVFTGDSSITEGLDSHDLAGNTARKAWEAMLALNDYVAESRAGRCDSDVHGYLMETPGGLHGFSAQRHARNESEDVRNNAKFAGRRILPVPIEVHLSGQVGMWAHFKLAQSGMTSPRLHYYDASQATGCVYVGYIGPHLPTSQTN